MIINNQRPPKNIPILKITNRENFGTLEFAKFDCYFLEINIHDLLEYIVA